MNWLVCCFLILQTALLIKSAPAEAPTEENKPDCKDAVTDVYDERQNGTDMNVRIHMKGIAIIVASPEVGETALQSFGENQNLNSQESVALKPPPPSTPDGSGPLPVEGGMRERTKVKLTNLLQFLKHVKANQSQ